MSEKAYDPLSLAYKVADDTNKRIGGFTEQLQQASARTATGQALQQRTGKTKGSLSSYEKDKAFLAQEALAKKRIEAARAAKKAGK